MSHGLFAPPVVPAPIYAVGPVRGEVTLLRKLVARILRDLPRRPRAGGLLDAAGAPAGRRQPVADLVLLGNLIAGGSSGLDVLDCMAEIAAEPALRLTLLLGPQELHLRRFLAGECDGERWLSEGGISFLVAAGIEPRLDAAPERLRKAVSALLGPRRALLEGMPPSVTIGNVLLSHGGGAADRPLDAQDVEALVFGPSSGRQPRTDGIWTVHADALRGEPLPDAGVIGLCSGAHYSQRLVALRIDADGGLGLLEVRDEPAPQETSAHR
ncbi:MAG: hypothetical protein AAF844_14220 [Pseudomonadota bacterium]